MQLPIMPWAVLEVAIFPIEVGSVEQLLISSPPIISRTAPLRVNRCQSAELSSVHCRVRSCSERVSPVPVVSGRSPESVLVVPCESLNFSYFRSRNTFSAAAAAQLLPPHTTKQPLTLKKEQSRCQIFLWGVRLVLTSPTHTPFFTPLSLTFFTTL